MCVIISVGISYRKKKYSKNNFPKYAYVKYASIVVGKCMVVLLLPFVSNTYISIYFGEMEKL